MLRSCAVLLCCGENWAVQKETSPRWCGHSGAAHFKPFLQICLINKRYILECWVPAVVDRRNSLGCAARDSYSVRIRLTLGLFDNVALPSSSFPCATQPIVGVYFTALYRALASSRTSLLDHTQQRATFGRTPLNE